jgi:tyrosine-protein kinase Etk/Wzc
MTEDIQYNQQANKSKVSPREIVLKYIRYVPWIVISVVVLMALAYLKLRYSTPIYSVSGKILVVRNNNRAAGGDKYDDIFMMQGASNNLNDEIELIKSRSMASRVVRSLGLQTRYYKKGNIRTSVMHQAEFPYWFDVQSITDSSGGFGFQFTPVNATDYLINQDTKTYHYGELVKLPGVTFKLLPKPNIGEAVTKDAIFIVEWVPLESASIGLSGGINVVQVGDFTNVLALSYQTENTRLGLDVVNQFMLEYQKASLEDKKQQAVYTLNFIDAQLDTVKHELGGVETNLLNTRQQYEIFNPEQQSQLFFNELGETNTEIKEQIYKLRMVDYLSGYIDDKSNPYRKVLSSLEIQEPSFIQQVMEYNKLQLERETALKTTKAANPLIKNLEAGIEKIRIDMLANLQNVRESYKVAINQLNAKNNEAAGKIRAIPMKEKAVLDVTRRKDILQELYSFLLQKKLETSISSASTISNIKVLEPALASGGPILPNRKGLYTIALIIGLAVPAGIIFLKEYLNDKVNSKQDIERMTAAPILGEVGHATDSGALIVTKNNRHFIAEQFRIVRSNLQYILPKVEKPAIMVTSSFSGEGKSFISTNLGAVLALSGKKTVILEFDIRKPKILEGLGLHERKGITNYIVGNISIQEIIYPVPDMSNLFVIPCGPVPPNPAEMLLDEKVTTLFEQLRRLFDVVIVDTAPVGLVSDAITLGQHADATVYIVRHNYTFKKQVQLIDELYKSKKIPHLAITINDVDLKQGYGGYYGYGNYGYGYGYESKYFDKDDNRRKKGIFGRIKRFFK